MPKHNNSIFAGCIAVLLLVAGCDPRFDSVSSGQYDFSPVNLSIEGVAQDHPAWSPDGTLIAYQARRPSVNVWRHDLISGESQNWRSCPGSFSGEFAISSDGKRVVFLDSEKHYVWIGDLVNKTSRLLAQQRNAAGFAWSEKGEALAYSFQGQIWIIFPGNEGFEEPIPMDGSPGLDLNPTWSPDHQNMIAFESQDGERRTIWIAPVLGTNPSLTRQITPDSVLCFAPDWAPNDSKIAYHSIRGDTSAIWCIDINTRQETLISDSTANASQPSWSPDGTKIAYRADNLAWISSAEGDLLEAATTTVPISRGKPIWTDDSQGFLLMGNGLITNISAVSIIDSSKFDITLLRDANRDTYPVWEPDMQNMIFVRDQPGFGFRLFTTPIDLAGPVTDRARPLISDANYAPDHNRDISPALSPDGRWLLWDAIIDNFGVRTRMLKMEAPSIIDLTKYTVDDAGISLRDPSWGPDSRSAVFESERSGGLQVVLVDTALAITSTIIEPPSRDTLRDPCWSPADTNGDSWIAAAGRRGIYIMRPDGREMELIIADGERPCWSPDGKKLAFIKDSKLVIMSVWTSL